MNDKKEQLLEEHRSSRGETPQALSLAIGAAIFALGGVTALLLSKRARTSAVQELVTNSCEPVSGNLASEEPGSVKQASTPVPAGVEPENKPKVPLLKQISSRDFWVKIRTKDFWKQMAKKLMPDHEDPLAHYTTTLLSSIGIVFILSVLARNSATSSAAQSALKLLLDHISEIPPSIINFSIAFTGIAAAVSMVKFFSWVKSLFLRFSEFTLHLLVIGIGASVGSQIVFAVHAFPGPIFNVGALMSLLWLCINALIVALTILLVLDAPDDLIPQEFAKKFTYATCGLIASIYCLAVNPIADIVVWNDKLVQNFPELKARSPQGGTSKSNRQSAKVESKLTAGN